MGKKVFYVVLVILAALLGLAIGSQIWEPVWKIPSQFKYDILRDTLTIVLAVIAIGMTTVSIFVYQLMSGRLKAESAIASRLQTIKGSIRLFLVSGFIFWEFYDKGGRMEPQYLDLAIDLTEMSLQSFNELPDSEAKTKEGDLSLCKVENNLAYYYADRKKPENKDTAIEYAKYIRKRASSYPKEKDNWLETCDFVDKQYAN